MIDEGTKKKEKNVSIYFIFNKYSSFLYETKKITD